jgi:hypothetical protein
MYESDITQFMRKLLDERPQIREEQRKGRAMWWDKQLDLDELERQRAARVPQKAYVYQTDV